MSETNWATELMGQWRLELPAVIESGNDRLAGILAGRLTCFTNAIARVKSGRSTNLYDDPLFGRSMNIVEYFNNPRAATPEDDLGTITDWSI